MHSGVPAIQLENVTKIYRVGFWRRPLYALKKASLTIHQGEIFGYLGPNGAGKTTTIKLLIGLLYPDGGSLRVFGGSPHDPEVKQRLGYMPENPYFYEYLTVQEYLQILARIYRMPTPERKQRIDEVMETLHLTPHRKKRIRQLSKGLMQRLSMAQAILHQPELLILDEPLSGLDPLGRRELRELIFSLRENCTIFFSSHILADAEMLCDRVGILLDGEIVKTGTLSELVTGEIRYFDVWVKAEPDAFPSLENAGFRRVGPTEWERRCPDETDLNATIDTVRSIPGAQLRAVNPVRRSLEDIFIQTVREGGAG